MDVGIHVDRDLCIGSGQCVHWAPGAFDQDDRAIAVVVDPRGEPEARVVRAVLACPMRAISLAVDGRRVGPDDLRDWVRGLDADDPIVVELDRLSGDHELLRAALHAGSGAGAGNDPSAVEELCARTAAHLRDEEAVYARIAEVAGAELVDAFQHDHGRIDAALAAATEAGPAERAEALAALARAVDDHIRLEESVLFPAALAAVARRAAGVAG